MAKNNKTRFFYDLYSDKTWVFDQSERAYYPIYIINIYIYILKTELRILDFQHFYWLAGHKLSAHIPALPNMVNECISK